MDGGIDPGTIIGTMDAQICVLHSPMIDRQMVNTDPLALRAYDSAGMLKKPEATKQPVRTVNIVEYYVVNTSEYVLGTNPLVADTDGDGVNDGDEEAAGTSPRAKPVDTTGLDGEGLTDAEDAVLGTNPFNWDSDRDGFSDKEEIDAGTDPLDPTSMPTPETEDPQDAPKG